ncbi:unnamed protein product [Linum tenue]|uniref:Uncharacterized protein n=1 Tax=Linum tenue TaxID=586396 RepID=A0AAV0IZG2_9ROSI|nr:unnamed protein product [Linum tenue]
MDELNHSLLYTTLELEQTRMAAQEELKKRDDQLIQLKEFLGKAIHERDDAQEKCQRVLFETLLLHQNYHQNAPPLSGISSVEDEPRREIDSNNNNNGFSSSDCEESIVSSPVLDPIPPPQAHAGQELEKLFPEKGKLLQAVMKAGSLLQTLLLAGPLPQWRHPPPPLESFEIPPGATRVEAAGAGLFPGCCCLLVERRRWWRRRGDKVEGWSAAAREGEKGEGGCARRREAAMDLGIGRRRSEGVDRLGT